jgi:hypothetical protein
VLKSKKEKTSLPLAGGIEGGKAPPFKSSSFPPPNLPPQAGGWTNILPAMKAIGVPEITKYLEGEITIEEVIEKAQQGTRNYVKRQITWFKNQMPEFMELGSESFPNIDEYTQ